MLVRFSGCNYRSLEKDFELSMLAADYKNASDNDRGVIEVAIEGMEQPLRLLRVVAIYGPNGSGKSTVLNAAYALKWLVRNSSNSPSDQTRVPMYEPFALDQACGERSIRLGCDVVHDNKILRYEIEYTKGSIAREFLAIVDGQSEIALIDRRESNVQGDLVVKSEANKLYTKGIRPDVLVLSKLAQHGSRDGDESASPYYNSIMTSLNYEDYTTTMGRPVGISEDVAKFAEDDAYKEWVMNHLIRGADVGICDVVTSKKEFDMPEVVRNIISETSTDVIFPDEEVVVSFVHDGADRQSLDFGMESRGTQKLFSLANDWWHLARGHGALMADELGASLHPKLLDRLVRAVNEPGDVSLKSQLIITAHETGLLEGRDGLPPALRRDQVYFTTKDKTGRTELYSLTEFKEDARSVHNIRKRYMSGVYGALPSLGELSL